MGLFGLFRKAKKQSEFVPNFKKSKYDNWLAFLEFGGTSKEWNQMVRENQWKFAESDIEIFERYQKEVKRVTGPYYKQMEKIQQDWSALYKSGVYTGAMADALETECKENIKLYKRMKKIDEKYGESTATNIPAFKRLAMLYEKQERFEEATAVCAEAISLCMDERNRMARMIKKAGRKPTQEELCLIENKRGSDRLAKEVMPQRTAQLENTPGEMIQK